jgi:hypothetical protein
MLNPNPKLAMEIELVKSAGIDAGKLTHEIVYEFAGKIIHDPLVTILAQNEYLRTRELVPAQMRGVMQTGTRAKVIRNVLETERAALRERIGVSNV